MRISKKYIDLSIASTTRQTYSSDEKRFINLHIYKRKAVEECLPASETLLSGFVAFLAKSFKYPSIKTYLAAVRHFYIRHGFRTKFKQNAAPAARFKRN